MDCCCLRIQQNCFDTYIFVFYKLLNDAIFVGKSMENIWCVWLSVANETMQVNPVESRQGINTN